MASKKTVQQEDLRRLMKKKTELERKKIDSPLAKYNSLGQLICNICQMVIKSESLWAAHLLSRSHKENASDLLLNLKRKATDSNEPSPPLKVIKSLETPKPKSILKNPLPLMEKVNIKIDPSEKLNLDSYESSSSSSSSSSDEKEASDTNHLENEINEVKTISQVLPEGFFDNPIQDAKVRKVPYKDNLESEIQLFQKEIKEQTMVSETIQGEDDDLREEERIIEEIDDQMSRWRRIEELANQKQPVIFKKNNKYFENDSDNDLDDLDDLDYDWKSKCNTANSKQ